jgi:hypothetical protein
MEKLTFKQFPFLTELGLREENFGCNLNGVWQGKGDWTVSVNPNTGEAIAKIK